MRERLGPSNSEADPYFRWRGGQVSRIEGLSDGIFALAIALLALGNVPRDHASLILHFKNVPAFAVCFLFLVWCWWYHFKFFRRYGLQDMTTAVINAVLLFVVLFFVNPLGYVAHVMITRPVFGLPGGGQSDPTVILWYAVGYTLIFACFLVLNLNAWRYRDHFELDEVERSLARTAIGEQCINVGVGLASIGFALTGQHMLAGWIFMSLGLLHGIFGWRRGVRTIRLVEEAKAAHESA